MSKRAFFLILFAIFLTAVGAIAVLQWRSGGSWFQFGPPEFTEVIPEKRPRRIDRKQLNRFEGQSMEEILRTLDSEQPVVDTAPKSRNEILLEKLPDAPVPYDSDVSPRDKEGLKTFITEVQQNTEKKPTTDDLFRFNMALAAMQIPASQVPAALRVVTQPSIESETFAVKLEATPIEVTGAIAPGDFNGDGSIELVAGGGTQVVTFSENSATAAQSGWPVTIPADTIEHADFDADGDLDAYLVRSGGMPDSLLRNDGNGRMTDVTIEKGLLAFVDTSCAAWFDYDGDGLLDLLVGSHDSPMELYHQTSGGAFQPVAWDLKWWVHRGLKSITVGDLSGDGLPDVYLGLEGQADRLCVTTPGDRWESWRFEDISTEIDMPVSREAWTSLFFDFDNNGQLDLLLASGNSGGETEQVQLLHHSGEMKFTNVTEDTGMKVDEAITSCIAADIDGDGFEDLLFGTPPLRPNRIFWNRLGTGFREITAVSRGGFLDTPARMFKADFDDDGSLDLLFENGELGTRRLETIAEEPSHYLTIELSRELPDGRVEMLVRDNDWIVHKFHRQFGLEKRNLIGIGRTDVIEELSLFGPGATKPFQTIEKTDPNQILEISVPAEPRKRPLVPVKTGAAAN